jgi:hypothetical protein
MRLPGTINIPNEKKRKQGRATAPATVLLDYCSNSSYSLDELAAWAPPTTDRRSNSSEKALPEINMALVRSASDYNDLPIELRTNFDKARKANPSLENLWRDGPLSLRQDDTSRSVQVFALGRHLKRDGRFTPTEFGQLLWVWEHGYSDEADKIIPRLIGRAWANNDVQPASNEEFEDISTWPNARDGSAQQTGTEWEEPTDLWADAADPPDLAEGVLPPALERWVKDEAERKGVDLGVMAVPAVVVCAAAIPAQFRLQVKQEDTGHTTCAVLWGAIVGGPGSRKSPVLGAAKAPIQSVEEGWDQRNRAARQEYERQQEAYERRRKAGEEVAKPVPPRQLRKIVMDTTVEALVSVLANNPAGLLCFRDELAQWAGNMDAYRAGKPVSRDQGFWLEAKDQSVCCRSRRPGGGVC